MCTKETAEEFLRRHNMFYEQQPFEDLTDILTFAELEVRVKTVDMLQKDGMIDRLEERLKRAVKEVDARDETEIG